jgi:leader peptidase (prepilin peptidase)/N-methyltransferase
MITRKASMLNNTYVFLQLHPVLWTTIIGFLSLSVGSFLNVLIYRLPKIIEQSWRSECSTLFNIEVPTEEKPTSFNLCFPASHCPSCKNTLRCWHNIPLLSYICLKGRCAFCQTPISLRYPSIELLCVVLSSLIAYWGGCSPMGIFGILLTWILLGLAFIDLDTQLLPDNIVLPTLWLGLLLNTKAVWVPLQDAVWGAALGYFVLWLIMWIFKLITGRQGMGHGDFKLFALFGAWFGWMALPYIILAASSIGAVVGIVYLFIRGKDYQTPLPFGPFLAMAGYSWMLYGLVLS